MENKFIIIFEKKFETFNKILTQIFHFQRTKAQ
jgi:hypothetical protein